MTLDGNLEGIIESGMSNFVEYLSLFINTRFQDNTKHPIEVCWDLLNLAGAKYLVQLVNRTRDHFSSILFNESLFSILGIIYQRLSRLGLATLPNLGRFSDHLAAKAAITGIS